MMCDIKPKVEGPGTCRGCLSSDRKLASLRQLSCDQYYSLLTEEQKLEVLSVPHIALCWECIALLRRTQRFRDQVQKAHTILHESTQLLSVEPTLSSLSFRMKLKYDVVLEENQPYETQKATTGNDKVIIPKKYNSSATKCNEDNVKCENIKDVINDLLINVEIKIEDKVEHPCSDSYDSEDNDFLSKEKIKKEYKVKQPCNDSCDSEDNMIFEYNDNNISSPEEISEVENNSKILQKVIHPKQNSKPLKKKVSKQIEKKHSSNYSKDNDNEYKPKRKIQKKSELDADFNLEDNDNYASDDCDNFKPIRIKKAKEQFNTDPNLTAEGVDTKNKRKSQPTYRRIITQYKDIEELAPYFTEIEMSEQDIKITLEKDDAIVDDRVKKKPIKCIICGLMSRRSLRKHAMQRHKAQYPNQIRKGMWINPPPMFPQKSVWQCNVCSRMKRREHIVAHMNEYHRTQYFCIGDGCEWCKRPFWNKQDFEQHWEEIHKKSMCDYCDISKKSKMRLEAHIQFSHATRVTNQCKLCMKVLSSAYALKVHALVHEENKEPLERRYCVECNLTFKRIKIYESHLKDKHSGKKKGKYSCETCGKVLCNKVTLRNHVNIMHKGTTPYYCHICGKYLSKKQTLKQHLNSHNNVKIPKTKPCTVCGRMFQTNRILRTHMYTHTGERPYKCSRCDVAFTQSHCLRVHLAKQHQVEARVRSNGTIIEGSKGLR